VGPEYRLRLLGGYAGVHRETLRIAHTKNEEIPSFFLYVYSEYIDIIAYMKKVLGKEFFNRPADVVARELLGCTLCVRVGGEIERHTITEVEAYLGPHDLACHAAKGRTPRTETMYQEAGTIYAYLVYGMYIMLNFVTGEKDWPAAVLIRGAGPYDGPGKLTKVLDITRNFNGKKATRATGLWVEGPVGTVSPKRIKKSPRIGIDYAGPVWAKKHLRFFM
jgi:DNA-3-methyladenine glycosylase